MGKGKKKKNVTKKEESESESSPKESIPPCSFPGCTLDSLWKCSACQKASYCSKPHQKQDWKEHKQTCTCFRVGVNAPLGKHLLASRDIKEGEIIIQEKPLLITPPKITLPVCLGCYSDFKQDGADTDDGQGVKPYACRNGCGWPMCKSLNCSNSKDHLAECLIAKERGGAIVRNADCEHPLYQLIGILRALGLKSRDPLEYEKLMSLQAHVEERKEFQRKVIEEQEGTSSMIPQNSSELKADAVMKIIKDFFKREDISEEWIERLFGILETNGHEIPIPDEDGHINRRIIGVYHNSSYLEHNCLPNCIKTFDLSTKEILIRSSVPIKKGQHLSITYVDPLWGTHDRMSLLKMTKFFTCKCPRCLDPTELKAHISSLRCQHLKCMNTKEGMVLPLPEPELNWKCNTCKEEYNPAYVSSLVSKVAQELDQLHSKVGDISAKEDFLRKFAKNLSPNHFYLLEIKVELAQLYGRTGDEPLHMLGPKKLLRKIQICEELLKVFCVICPGYNRLRCLILYELQAAFLMLSRMRHGVGEISLEKHLQELMQCGKWMSEVILVLGWESHNSIERKRALGAERDLEQLRQSVLSLSGHTEKKAEVAVSPPQVIKEKRSHLQVEEESFIEEVF